MYFEVIILTRNWDFCVQLLIAIDVTGACERRVTSLYIYHSPLMFSIYFLVVTSQNNSLRTKKKTIKLEQYNFEVQYRRWDGKFLPYSTLIFHGKFHLQCIMVLFFFYINRKLLPKLVYVCVCVFDDNMPYDLWFSEWNKTVTINLDRMYSHRWVYFKILDEMLTIRA